ncbi:hypothetical protein G5B47_22235 [Paenibacillus sp. 7124]|uniref:Uncharacterized protein n=1 Tax=Paenibacillus apii TaxID=1850370 RepID=A0A6M1PSR3_9BACL|nr:hypothetical protein [Paenibacillus apii]NGM85125.1 hypothetical protein [Paenibacillus apii]
MPYPGGCCPILRRRGALTSRDAQERIGFASEGRSFILEFPEGKGSETAVETQAVGAQER